jgi:hypothetical protein
MPVTLTKPEEIEQWLDAPVPEVLRLQRPRAARRKTRAVAGVIRYGPRPHASRELAPVANDARAA